MKKFFLYSSGLLALLLPIIVKAQQIEVGLEFPEGPDPVPPELSGSDKVYTTVISNIPPIIIVIAAVVLVVIIILIFVKKKKKVSVAGE